MLAVTCSSPPFPSKCTNPAKVEQQVCFSERNVNKPCVLLHLAGHLGENWASSEVTHPAPVTPQFGGHPAAVTPVHTLIKGELQESSEPAINTTQGHKMQSCKSSIRAYGKQECDPEAIPRTKCLHLPSTNLRPDLAGIGKAGANALLNLLALFQAVRTVQA